MTQVFGQKTLTKTLFSYTKPELYQVLKRGEQKIALTLLTILSLFLAALSLPLASATEESWTTLEPMPTARRGIGVGVVDGKIYVFSGSSTEEYDPATDTWSNKKPMPTRRDYFGTAVVGEKIYVIGGETNIRIFNITEVYDPKSDTWETKSEFQTWREFPVVNAVDEKIYLMAGLRRGFESAGGISKTEMYDPETDIWTTGASIPSFGNIQLGTLPSAVLDECIYLMHENITYIYDTQNDAWSYGATSPIKIYGAVAGATTGEFASKRIHLLKMSLHYVYDPENDSWTQETPMLTSRSYVGVAVVNDEIYVIGGYDGENYRNENEKYTPQGYIPEFPSWVILPLFFVATLVGVAVRGKVFRPT